MPFFFVPVTSYSATLHAREDVSSGDSLSGRCSGLILVEVFRGCREEPLATHPNAATSATIMKLTKIYLDLITVSRMIYLCYVPRLFWGGSWGKSQIRSELLHPPMLVDKSHCKLFRIISQCSKKIERISGNDCATERQKKPPNAMGSSISIVNDLKEPIYVWYQLRGGSAPAGGYGAVTLAPSDATLKEFTLSLPITICTRYQLRDQPWKTDCKDYVSPPLAGQQHGVNLSEITTLPEPQHFQAGWRQVLKMDTHKCNMTLQLSLTQGILALLLAFNNLSHKINVMNQVTGGLKKRRKADSVALLIPCQVSLRKTAILFRSCLGWQSRQPFWTCFRRRCLIPRQRRGKAARVSP